MKNRLLVILIIIAAIFPFAATGIELIGQDLMALIALGVMTVIAFGVTFGAMRYRPKNTADVDTPMQAIPTIKPPPRKVDSSIKGSPTRAEAPAKASSVQQGTSKKPDPKRQRAR